MLDSHPEIAFPPETAFLKHVVTLSGDMEAQRRRFVDVVTADRTPVSNWSDFGLDRGAFAARIAALSPFTAGAGTREFYRMYAESQGKPRSGEKTPGQHLRDARDRRIAAGGAFHPRDPRSEGHRAVVAAHVVRAEPGFPGAGAGLAPPCRRRPAGRRRCATLRRNALRGSGAATRGDALAAVRFPRHRVHEGDARFQRTGRGAHRSPQGADARQRAARARARIARRSTSISRSRGRPSGSASGGAK